MHIASDARQYNPFEHASFKEQLKAYKRLAVVDYDRTLTTGEREPSTKELSDQEDVWRIVAQANAVDACISARTPAMMMDSERYQHTVAHGFTEPMPHLRYDPATERFEYQDPATIPFYKNAVNRKMIASFGWGIFVENGQGYRIDRGFEQLLAQTVVREDTDEFVSLESAAIDPTEPVRESQVPSSWKLAALTFLIARCLEFQPFLAKLERDGIYAERKIDVAPLPFRLQFDFTGTEGLLAKQKLERIVREAKLEGDLFARRIRVIDESRINEAEPEKSHWTTYWVPWYGTKEHMFNRMLIQSSAAAGYAAAETDLYYAGDSPTDLRIGLWGGGGAETKFLLPTGSFLAPYLIKRAKRYGSVNLSWLFGGEHVNPRLIPTGRLGEYRLEHKLIKRIRGGKSNLLVIGDERYKGMTPPGSVAAFFEEYMLYNKRAGH